MKLKLFLISILVLLSLVGYKTYTETKALKSINSYESCVAAKGSLIQESYPSTCITRLGTRFSQPLSLDNSPLPPNTYDFCGSLQPKTQFTLSIPQGWKLSKSDGSPDYQKYYLSNDVGTEWIRILCGKGFGGGGCDTYDFSLIWNNQSAKACSKTNHSTGIVDVYDFPLLLGGNDLNSFLLSAHAKESLLRKFLSTFHFLD